MNTIVGKSVLFEALEDALVYCGFNVVPFRKMGDRFGMAEVALSDLTLKDDTVDRELEAFLKTENTKTLCTNGIMEVEVKFGAKLRVQPKTVIMLNANNCNKNWSYSLDSGILSRTKVISTYRKAELVGQKYKVTGASKGTPALEPEFHIPYLAKKYGVSEMTIMLKAIVDAGYHFYDVINKESLDDEGNPRNNLHMEVNKWTSHLRFQFQVHVEKAILNAMVMARAIRNHSTQVENFFVPEMTPEVMLDYLSDLYHLVCDDRYTDFIDTLKEDWDANGRDQEHFYAGIRQVRWDSVSKTLSNGFNGKTESEIFKSILLRSGLTLGAGKPFIVEHWNQARSMAQTTMKQAKALVYGFEKLPGLTDPRANTFDDWMLDNPRYSPDIAEKLKRDSFAKRVS